MATTIHIKRSTGTSAPSSLAAGEVAVTFGTGTVSNLGDRLFIGDGSNVDVIGGKFFSDMLDHTQGTLTASSALTVDGNKALDYLRSHLHFYYPIIKIEMLDKTFHTLLMLLN